MERDRVNECELRKKERGRLLRGSLHSKEYNQLYLKRTILIHTLTHTSLDDKVLVFSDSKRH